MAQNINCNNFRTFLKCIEPIGKDILFKFSKDEIFVNGIGKSNEIIAELYYEASTGYEGEVGLSVEVLKNLLPKTVETVDVEWGKTVTLTAPGFNARILQINEVDCARRPKKEIPVVGTGYICSPQQVYERLDNLEKAFDGQAFTLKIDEKEQGLISFSDEDNAIGRMANSVVTTSPIDRKMVQSYPYDITMPVLNAIRIGSQTMHIHFIDLPSNESVKALGLRGQILGKDLLIDYFYMIAPRLIA